MDNSGTLNLLTGLAHLYPEDNFLKNLYKTLTLFPEVAHDDFLSEGQIKSKKWLVDELSKVSSQLGLVYLVPGWYGLLSHFIQQSQLNFTQIRSFDIDAKAVQVSEQMNRHLFIDSWKFKAACLDIMKIDYQRHLYEVRKGDGSEVTLIESPDTIINTACEHVDYQKWLELIPKGKLVVLQNNNFFGCEGHTHCVSSAEEFKNNCQLSEVYFSGELNLAKYNRYMIIGRK